jgi:hypothetical protein
LWTALYSRLTGGTALTALLSGTTAIYDTVAPQGATLPYVVFNQQAGRTENLDGNRRDDVFVTVKAITAASLKAAEAIDAQVDTLLHDSLLTVTGYTALWQRRTESIRYAEPMPGGGHYYHAGGVYRIRLHKD